MNLLIAKGFKTKFFFYHLKFQFWFNPIINLFAIEQSLSQFNNEEIVPFRTLSSSTYVMHKELEQNIK